MSADVKSGPGAGIGRGSSTGSGSGTGRARRLLARPGAWIEDLSGVDGSEGHYALRTGPDRRARVALSLDEAQFRALIVEPGLKRRPGGGWSLRTDPARQASGTRDDAKTAGRPGVIEGERLVIGADGRLVGHRANLGESPIAWLARRKDAAGRPWLTPAEVCAGERLRADAERASAGPSLTMRWDALPRAGGGSSATISPGDAALSASRRVEAALNAVSPRVRSMLVHVCIRSSSLQLAEQALGLRRRQGKTLLKQGLDALAEHYRIG
ncbi:DUF6456 domain-containing protein [soil metagenome]